mmetsp:Transcript_32366/g.73054  ORF Transcript_32366/g.73054 Transcript_32366/m.73054 type:complete len:272 (+) Transcript_32366:1226-2041(+)
MVCPAQSAAVSGRRLRLHANVRNWRRSSMSSSSSTFQKICTCFSLAPWGMLAPYVVCCLSTSRSTSDSPHVRSSSSRAVMSESNRTEGTTVLNPARIASHWEAPSSSRALIERAQKVCRLWNVTSVALPSSMSSTVVPSESDASNVLKKRSPKRSASTPSVTSMCRRRVRELYSASSNVARSVGSSREETSRFHMWLHSSRSRLACFCSIAQPISLPKKENCESCASFAADGLMVNELRLVPSPCWPLGHSMKSCDALDCSSAQMLVRASR